MGNLCGRASKDQSDDAFAQPGRTLSSAPASSSSNPRAPVPKISSTSSGAGRTLGGAGTGAGAGASIGAAGQADGDTTDARRAAAKAAEDRAAKANQTPRGKLGRDLAKEKAQTRNGALGAVSREERRRRDADEGAEARNWN